ncbi:DUF4328 domain-containing protein [Pseudonocardia sp. ICBG601]|uniref:DUF4328 domain-containing protein n=1 Tax=Pseudonocardia sp. ICBG601 TaxID=2846759 RepID=UPI001CF6FA07|nr:DUF4328 domain-containing protein [Pseudonocardia sp. ICBG601]
MGDGRRRGPAAGAEVWRYVLLLLSRNDALSGTAVAASDALVVAAGIVTLLLSVLTGLVVVLWTVRASVAAAEEAGTRPSRTPRALVLAWVVPFWNLGMAGSVLAEIEHTVLGRAPDERPRPSRLLLVWWATWLVGGVLSVVVLLWGFRQGVQARADGVELHAFLDLLAAVSAALLAVLIVRINRMIGPPRTAAREVLVAVTPPTAVPAPGPAPEPAPEPAPAPVPSS